MFRGPSRELRKADTKGSTPSASALQRSLERDPVSKPLERAFRTDHFRKGLTGRSIRGGAITLGAQSAKLLINVLSIALLARLLAPGDFGLVAMVFAITGFVEVFKDLGLSAAIVQSKELTRKQIDTLFWLNASLGAVFAGLCLAAGPLIARFYGDARLTGVASIASIGFLFGGLAVQYQALLTRQMRFGVLAIADVISVSCGLTAAIVLAWLGYGYWALAWAFPVSAVFYLVAVVLPSEWKPGLPRWTPGVGSLIRIGGDITAFSVVNYFARNLDNILIGKVWGASAVGVYSRAYNLLLLPIRQISTPIGAVAFPALCALQSDPVRFRSYYLKVLFLITAVTTPLCLGLAVMAPEVVLIVLGPQWSEAADIFRILAISAVAQPVCTTSGWLYTATGNSRGLLRWGSIGALCLTGSFFIGLPFGPKGVAASYAVAIALWVYPCMWLAAKGTSVSAKDIFRVVAEPLLASVPGVAWIVLAKYALASALPLVVWLAVACSGMVFLYWLLLCKVLGKGALLQDVLSHLLARRESDDSMKEKTEP